MSSAARTYIIGTVAAGSVLLFLGMFAWTGTNIAPFAAFLSLGVACSIWKVSLPGVTSTLSINYIFVLIAASVCDLPQTLLIGAIPAMAQCIFRAKSRPRPIHVIFNASGAVVSSAGCYGVYHLAAAWKYTNHIPALFVLTSLAYYVSNSASVSGVISLTERKSFFSIFRESFLWTAPQYFFGATVAAVFAALSQRIGWDWALLIIPAMFVVYGSYRLYLRRLEEEQRHVKEMSALHLRTIEALAVAIDAKDETTHDHIRRVQVYALEIARELGLTAQETQALQAAALLHDIGKLAVPEYILSKPGRLTPEEFERVKIHPTVGAEILERVQFPYPVVPIVAAHHEKWDGSGYPNGLKGEEIPIGARILSVVDCFDALASDRQYRRALPLEEAIQNIINQAGSSFDARVVDILARRYRELERTAQATPVETTKLSREVTTANGVSPDAGFVEIASEPSAEMPNFVVSIANAREEFHALFQLIQALGSSLTLESALSLIGTHLKAIVPYDCIAIYIIEDGMLVPRHVFGADRALFASIRIPMGEGVSGWVAETQKVVVNGNPSVEPGYLRDPAKFSILLSVTSVPLIGSAGGIGVLSLYSRAKDSFTRDHVRLLDAVSSKAAIAIERAIELSRAREAAIIDPVTRIANTRALFLHLEAQLSRCSRNGETLTVLLVNLDDLKRISGRHGKTAASRLARSVGEALRGACREYDLVAHTNTEEFVIALSGADPAAIPRRIESLIRIAKEAAAVVIGNETIEISAGKATWPRGGETPESLLATADRDLYTQRRRIVTEPSEALASLIL